MGETVAVLTRVRAGEDPMGEPVWGWASELVPDVLVRKVSGSDLNDALRPDGVRVSYALAFPKAWTAGKPLGYLRHARVALVDRGMDASDAEGALRVSGTPDVTRPCPTQWNMLC